MASTDVISRLDGVTNGLLFDKRLGGDPSLIIRGRSTIFADNQPLIVVDNFPYNGDISNINEIDVGEYNGAGKMRQRLLFGV